MSEPHVLYNVINVNVTIEMIRLLYNLKFLFKISLIRNILKVSFKGVYCYFCNNFIKLRLFTMKEAKTSLFDIKLLKVRVLRGTTMFVLLFGRQILTFTKGI